MAKKPNICPPFNYYLLRQILFEATVEGIPQRVLGSASYQVGKMDVLNVSAPQSAVVQIFGFSILMQMLINRLVKLCISFLRGHQLCSSFFSSTTAACSQPTSKMRGWSYVCSHHFILCSHL